MPLHEVDYIVQGEWVLTMDAAQRVIKNGAVAVSNGKIVFVGEFSDIARMCVTGRVIGGADKVVMPGLINCHTHAAMVFMRGLADDLPLKDWLENYIWPAEKKYLSPEFINDAIELACLEMLKGGITAFADMYFYEDIAAEAVKRLGIRAVLGPGIVDFPTKTGSGRDDYLRGAQEFIKKWKGDELITPSVAPHSAYACSPETLKMASDLAKKYDVLLHIHLAETRSEAEDIRQRYRDSAVNILKKSGALEGHLLAAHCVWLTDEDIDTLAKGRVSVVHCVESNLKLASGIAPVPKMLASGLKVVLGTDGAASNNDLNILSEMSTAAKLHKVIAQDPTALNSKTALLMATRWAAEALGLDSITGSLEEGKSADLIVIDIKRPHLQPVYNIESQIVYSARACDIETVMVAGRTLVDKGRAVNIDEAEIIEKAKKWKEVIKGQR